MVLSRVERASLWKVMMMLVGGRSLQYISSVHLGEKGGRQLRPLGAKQMAGAGTIGIVMVISMDRCLASDGARPQGLTSPTRGREAPKMTEAQFPSTLGNLGWEPNKAEIQNIKVGFLPHTPVGTQWFLQPHKPAPKSWALLPSPGPSSWQRLHMLCISRCSPPHHANSISRPTHQHLTSFWRQSPQTPA